MKSFFTVAEAAELCGVSYSTIYRGIKNGELSWRKTRRMEIEAASLRQWALERKRAYEPLR